MFGSHSVVLLKLLIALLSALLEAYKMFLAVERSGISS